MTDGTDFDFGKNSVRSIRSRESFKPFSGKKAMLSRVAEGMVCKKLGVKRQSYHAPFDCIFGKLAIEIKSMYDDERTENRVFIRRECKERKVAFAKEHGLIPLLLVVDFRQDLPQFYFRQDLGSFMLNTMCKVKGSLLKEKLHEIRN